MEDDDFLDAIEADNRNAVEPEPVKVEVVAEPDVLELTDPVEPEPTPEPVRSDDAADGRLAALLDERDKRKASDARAAQLEQQLQSYQQAQAQPAQRPDGFDDPDGAAAYDQAIINQQLYQQRLHFSEQLASVKHGEEAVTAAKDWGFKRCESDPYFNAKVAASPDPIGFVVAEYKRDEIASKVTPDEFAQFQAWKTAQGQLQQVAQAAPTASASTIPPRSLASAPSAGNMLTTPVQDDQDIFDEVFTKR